MSISLGFAGQNSCKEYAPLTSLETDDADYEATRHPAESLMMACLL